MNVNEILDMVVDQAHVNTEDYPPTRILKYLNLIKNNFRSVQIAELWEDYEWDIFKADTVADQHEYVLPEMAWSTVGAKKVKSLAIKYDWLTYTPAREVKESDQINHWSYYQQHQDKCDPIYYIADNSVFIAPLIKSNIVDWIELRGLKNIENYAIDWTEASIWFPVDYHDILVQWTMYYVLKSQGKHEEAQLEYSNYKTRRDEAISTMTNRHTGPSFIRYPDESQDFDILN